MRYSNNLPFEELYGHTVKSVDGAKITLENGARYQFNLYGDCCSRSEYTNEGFEAFKELEGAKIVEIEDRDGESDTPSKTIEDGEDDKWHFLVVKTDKGHVTIDWRNASNGYYDGNIALARIP